MPEVELKGDPRWAADRAVVSKGMSGLRSITRWGVCIVATLLALWFTSTWFLFGSVHPCGVLAQRMRPRHSMIATLETLIESNEALLEGAPPADVATTHRAKVEDLRKIVYERTPASCFWRSLTWQWDPDHDAYIQWLENRRRETDAGLVEFTNRIVNDLKRKAQR